MGKREKGSGQVVGGSASLATAGDASAWRARAEAFGERGSRGVARSGLKWDYGEGVPEMSPGDFQNLLAFRTSLRRFMHWSQTQARAVGLTPAQHQLLVAIKGHPGPQDPTISELAEYLLLRHHSVVELVDRAGNAGIVARSRDAEDGRLTRVMLTTDGEARLRRLGPAHLDELRNLAPVLDQLVSEWAAHAEQQAAPEPG